MDEVPLFHFSEINARWELALPAGRCGLFKVYHVNRHCPNQFGQQYGQDVKQEVTHGVPPFGDHAHDRSFTLFDCQNPQAAAGSKPAPGPQTGYATLVILYGASHNACIAFFHIFMARSPLGGIGVKDVGRDFAPHKKNLQYQS